MGLTCAPLNLCSRSRTSAQQDMAAAAGISNRHQTAGRKHRNGPPDGDPLGAEPPTTPHTRPSPRRRPTSKGSRTPPARGGGHHAGGAAFRCCGSSGKKRPEKSGVKGAARPLAGRGRLRQNRQDNQFPDKTRIGRHPPDTNKTPAPGEGCTAYSYAGQGHSSPMRLRAKGMTHAGACCLDSRSRMYSMYGSTWRK